MKFMKNTFRSCAIGSMACVTALTSILFACSKDHSYFKGQGNGSGNTDAHVFLTGDPSLLSDHVFIDIPKVEIKAGDNDEMEHEREHQLPCGGQETGAALAQIQ